MYLVNLYVVCMQCVVCSMCLQVYFRVHCVHRYVEYNVYGVCIV